MSNPLDYRGKTVVVTGGTRGIGRAIALRFLGAGANVIICARNPPSETVRVGESRAAFFTCDVRQPEEVDALVAEVVKRWGDLDVLVNNAGGAPPADSGTASANFNRAVIELNLLAPITFAQAVHGPMESQAGGGVIINIASISGTRANPGGVAYGAAKAGLINATKTLASEWGPNVRVLAVVAGLVLTDEARVFYGDDDNIAALADTIALKRLGTPEDISHLCLFLASPLASYMSGAAVEIHGGGNKPIDLG